MPTDLLVRCLWHRPFALGDLLHRAETVGHVLGEMRLVLLPVQHIIVVNSSDRPPLILHFHEQHFIGVGLLTENIDCLNLKLTMLRCVDLKILVDLLAQLLLVNAFLKHLHLLD